MQDAHAYFGKAYVLMRMRLVRPVLELASVRQIVHVHQARYVLDGPQGGTAKRRIIISPRHLLLRSSEFNLFWSEHDVA